MLKVGGAERVALRKARDRVRKFWRADVEIAVGERLRLVGSGKDLDARVLRKVLNERIKRVLGILADLGAQLRGREIDQHGDVDKVGFRLDRFGLERNQKTIGAVAELIRLDRNV